MCHGNSELTCEVFCTMPVVNMVRESFNVSYYYSMRVSTGFGYISSFLVSLKWLAHVHKVADLAGDSELNFDCQLSSMHVCTDA